MPTWTARLTSNRRLTIPIGARRYLGIEPGDTVIWEVKDGNVYLRKKVEIDPDSGVSPNDVPTLLVKPSVKHEDKHDGDE
jgi:AbrB family looped-hinge helix DNA binding protein